MLVRAGYVDIIIFLHQDSQECNRNNNTLSDYTKVKVQGVLLKDGSGLASIPTMDFLLKFMKFIDKEQWNICVLIKAYKYRIYPNTNQKKCFLKVFLGCIIFV